MNVAQKTRLRFDYRRYFFWDQRHLIFQLIEHEIKARYYASFLGALWTLLVPLSTLVIYTFVFSVVLRSGWQGQDTPFAFILFAGLIPFTLFSDVLNRAPTLIISHPNYVKKVVFPLQILPVVTLGTAVVDSLISLALLVAGLAFFSHKLFATLFWLPLVYLPLLLITLGAAWILASLGVYIRDTGPAIGIFTRLWFFATPIVFPPENIPISYAWLLALNPLTSMVDSFRRILLWGQPPDWNSWGVWLAIGLAFAFLGYVWFDKTSAGFADVI